MNLHRPEPIQRHRAQPVDRNAPPAQAARRLRDGESLLVTDDFGTGLAIHAALRALLPAPADDAPYDTRNAFKRTWRAATDRLLVPITEHRVALTSAPTVQFLAELYPELRSFFLPFVQVQRLGTAWEYYERGVHLAVLGHRVHPFYGTYVPSRVSHLELFGTWLSQHEGPRGYAIDVGTGCGVLAFMLCKAGFERVLATDTNPNAIESVRRDLKRRPVAPPIEPRHCDLLGDDPALADLIVFNPPWMKGPVEQVLDGALYFEDGLFERFFDQADARLTPSGRVVMVFSTVLELVQPDVPHPIETELQRGRFREVKRLRRKVKPTVNASGERRRTRERVEVWELERAK
jgi:predicted nicotinamide N-methyase